MGWNGEDVYPLRADWGLEEALQGKGKMLLPKGLVLGTRRREGIAALTIRTVEQGRPKYWEAVGGARGLPFVVGRRGLPTVILESALDAALLFQEAGELVSAVATMGSSKPLDHAAAAFIKAAQFVIACPDRDDGGEAAWQRWSKCFPSARRVDPTSHKDLGEMHNAALRLERAQTVREWVEHAIAAVNRHAVGRAS